MEKDSPLFRWHTYTANQTDTENKQKIIVVTLLRSYSSFLFFIIGGQKPTNRETVYNNAMQFNAAANEKKTQSDRLMKLLRRTCVCSGKSYCK